ncbi:hypothetical protein AB0C28_41620 [Nonomuraea sp. NPDC048892]|uniref:hypothetical protein n=1 Tax=Nonomuraea sp. NPDC048892 TaxID=3154624 RepID=UPI0033EABD2B
MDLQRRRRSGHVDEPVLHLVLELLRQAQPGEVAGDERALGEHHERGQAERQHWHRARRVVARRLAEQAEQHREADPGHLFEDRHGHHDRRGAGRQLVENVAEASGRLVHDQQPGAVPQAEHGAGDGDALPLAARRVGHHRVRAVRKPADELAEPGLRRHRAQALVGLNGGLQRARPPGVPVGTTAAAPRSASTVPVRLCTAVQAGGSHG